MKVLIVGCGAVGQVYGLALQNAGVDLGILDRPAIAEKMNRARRQGGLPLFQISFKNRQDPILHRLKNYQVIADAAESRRFEPDQIWFTTPSPVYYSDWFQDFLRQVPSNRVVCFIPEGNRPEFISGDFGHRMIFGGTTFIAWQGDLGGGGGKPDGVNFWRPPLALPLVGNREFCRDTAMLLNRAGFRIMFVKPGSHAQIFTTAIMTAFVAGLELSGWSLKDFRHNPWLRCAAAACREAISCQLLESGIGTRLWMNPPVLSAFFSLASILMPVLFPFDVEKYLQFHYTKTREQSILLLDLFIKDCLRRGFPLDHIQALREGMLDSRHIQKLNL